MLTQEELEKCENPYEEIEKMEKGLVEEIKDREYNRGYEKGMEDMWETARKIVVTSGTNELPIEDFIEIFMGYSITEIFKKYSAKEAKEKIDNYIHKENETFHVGDEVKSKFCNLNKGVIIEVCIPNNGKTFIRILFEDTRVCSYTKEDAYNILTKTGRHFDEVEELLKMLKED